MNKPLKQKAGKTSKTRQGPTPPVVLQVVPALVSGGVERGTIDIAEALAAAGAKAYVASSGGPMETELLRAGVEHISLPLDSKNLFTMFKNIGRLATLIEAHGIEIVHARSRAPAWSAYYAAKRTGRPFVTTFHGTYNAQNAAKRFYNAIMIRGVRTIAISEFIASHVKRIYGANPDRIKVIHRGVDTTNFDPKAVAPARFIPLVNQWRLPDGVPVVMLPGRLTRWKGQTVFIEAIKRLGRKDICAVLVGPDQGRAAYREELEEMVQKNDLGKIVRIVDLAADMPSALMLADVVVSASTDPEAFGRVIAEAGAMGRPVIATDHGGAREQVNEDETGWLVPPGDPDALAAAIDKALSISKTKRAAMSKAAVRHIRTNFSKTSMCAETLKLYAEVAAQARS